MLRRVAALLLCITAAPGCAPSPSTEGWNSDDPGALLYAIQGAARSRDRTAVPHLVDALRSDDPAVRLLAEQTLVEITGTQVGYRHFDPPAERAAAIGRWVELLRREGWLPPAPEHASAAAPRLDASTSGRGETEASRVGQRPTAGRHLA